jgi:hypothetical protein
VAEFDSIAQEINKDSLSMGEININSINVFSEVKKIQSEEISIINRLKDVMNKMVEVQVLLRMKPTDKLQISLDTLELDRKNITQEYINIKNRYLEIDNKFEQEMEKQRNKLINKFQLCSFLKT